MPESRKNQKSVTLKLFIVAGEPSGDVHAANLVREIKTLSGCSEIELYGTGGVNLLQLGQVQLCDVQSMAAIGFDAAVRKIPLLYKLAKQLKAKIDEVKPDAIILVDYSGFNLRFAKLLYKGRQKDSPPVIELVAPQVWVWHYSRVKTLAKCFDKVLCILPFEEKLLRSEGVNAVYIGHPITDNIKFHHESKESFCNAYGLDPAKPIIGLIPGSRIREVTSLIPVMTEGIGILREKGGELPQFVLAQADYITDELLYQHLPQGLGVKVVKGATSDVMKFSSILWICSGTATLEAAIIGTPMIIMYKSSFINLIIAKMLTSLRMVGLPNIIAGELIVPELLVHHCTGENLIKAHEAVSAEAEKYRERLAAVGKQFEGLEPMKNAAKEVLAMIPAYKNVL
jgi:lipid-A-disaccharide synthase